MFWHIIPRSVIFIADLRVLPSRALLRNSFLFISVLGLLFPHFLQVASKSNGFKEPQPSGTFMSHKLREGSVIVGNQMTRGSRGAGWIMGISVDPGHLASRPLPFYDCDQIRSSFGYWFLSFLQGGVVPGRLSAFKILITFLSHICCISDYFWGYLLARPSRKYWVWCIHDHVFMFFISVFLCFYTSNKCTQENFKWYRRRKEDLLPSLTPAFLSGGTRCYQSLVYPPREICPLCIICPPFLTTSHKHVHA